MMVMDFLSEMGYTVLSIKQKHNHIDAVLGKKIDGRLTCCGVAEIKSRQFARNQKLTVSYLSENGGYLVSKHKIDRGQTLGKMLGVPYFLIVHLMEDDCLLVWEVTDDNGEYKFDFEIRRSLTKETCNGGLIERINCFLPISKSKRIEFSKR